MSDICKNWTEWLKKNRFAGQTPEMIEQTTKWLEAVRDVILVYAEIKPYETILDESGVTEGYEILQTPVEHIALPESTVHKAIMRSVLVHVVNKQPAINEIYRVLKPGGKLCAFEPVIRSNTRYWEILDSDYIDRYEDFKHAENEIMENPLDSLCNFDENTLRTNLEIAGFSIPEVKLQEVRSSYVVQENMVREWFVNPPSPNQPSTKQRFLRYFEEETVEKFMAQVQEYLTGRTISLKTNAVFINATK